MNYISYYYRQVEWFAAARLTPLGAGGGFHEELQPGAGGGRRGASVGPRGGTRQGEMPRLWTLKEWNLVKHQEKWWRTKGNVGFWLGSRDFQQAKLGISPWNIGIEIM
jgi:hypothetical protein